MINWNKIETVLLDMDGTLLDLHYDNYFWTEHLPLKLAELQGLEVAEAREIVLRKTRNKKGTLLWYCVDHWSDDLGVDIMALKADLQHKIAVRPYATEFMQALCEQGKQLIMVTNAHRKLIEVKLKETDIGRYFQQVVSAHDLGHPKEEQKFWAIFSEQYGLHIDSTIFIDDNLDVLRSARAYGLKHLLAIELPDSQGPRRQSAEFHCIESFADLIPGDSCNTQNP
ncbi:MAG: GMP/IMP nucleotidase [Gammaproteobacteria bacterium]